MSKNLPFTPFLAVYPSPYPTPHPIPLPKREREFFNFVKP
ncbi:hypothetical protein A45J_1968 [hot springs metagenome]|uniref:Uncharacterized protein n=1 Tax=hot springs metagenome TaxID=433727 RepID=A0A5J4KXA1_9ZZZZ